MQELAEVRTPHRWRWIALACTAGVLVAAWRFLALAGFSDDHYLHMSAAQQIAFGEWPSRDFVDTGEPLTYLASAAVFWLVPQTPLFGEAVFVAVLFGLAAVLTVFAVRRLTGSLLLAVLAVALEIIIFPRTYSYPKLLPYAAGFLAMWRYLDLPTRGRMVQLAVVVVIACLFRYDHGVYIGFGGLVTVIVAAFARQQQAARKTAVYALMVTAMLVPYGAYVARYDGLANHFRRGIEMRALENNRGREAPVFVGAMTTANAVPWLYYEFYLLPLVTAAVAFARWRRRESSEPDDCRDLALVVPLIAVAIPMNFGLIRETVSARLPDAVVPACLQLAWLGSCARRMQPGAYRTLAWTGSVAVLVLTATSAVVIGSTKEQLERAEVFGGVRRVAQHVQDRTAQLRARFSKEQMPSRTAYALMPFFAYVDRCLAPRDRILVPAFLPEVSVWARRPFAGGQIVFQAGALAGDSDHRLVMQRLNAQRVPVTVLSPKSDQITSQFKELSAYVQAHFTEFTEASTEDGPAIRIGFDPTLAVSRDEKTGWHCYR